MLNKYNLKISQICASDNGHPEITGVFYDGNRTVATDYYQLIEVMTPQLSLKDYPVIPNLPKAKRPKTPVIIPKKACQDLSKNLPVNNSLPILENAVFLGENNNMITLATTDLETAHPIITRKIEGEYPKHQAIIPKQPPKTIITLNPYFLKQLASIVNDLTDKPITLKVYEKDMPIMIEGKTPVNQSFKALIMPIKA